MDRRGDQQDGKFLLLIKNLQKCLKASRKKKR